MNPYGFELSKEDQNTYEENKQTVDTELARLVTEEQNRQLKEGSNINITPEQHRAFFDQAMSNLSGTGKTRSVGDSDTQPSLIRATERNKATVSASAKSKK